MCCTASIASRFSVRLTGSPALRSSTTNPANRSSIDEGVSPEMLTVAVMGPCRLLDRQLLGGLGDVGLVLEQDVERLLGGLLVDRVDVEQQQGARPVERLGDARRLLQVELADRPHDPADLIGEV